MTVENVGLAVTLFSIVLLVVGAVSGAITRWWLARGNETDRYYKSAIEGLEADNRAKDLTITRQQGEIEGLKRAQAEQAQQIKMLTGMVQGREDIANALAAVLLRFDSIDQTIEDMRQNDLREIKAMAGGTRAGEISERSAG